MASAARGAVRARLLAEGASVSMGAEASAVPEDSRCMLFLRGGERGSLHGASEKK